MRNAALSFLLILAACGPQSAGYDPAPPADAPPAAAAPAASPPHAPSVAPTPAWAGDFDLTGTEPFWGLRIRPATLTLTGLDQPTVSTPNPGPTADGEAGVWTTPAFSVRLVKGECSDGMSDRVYPYIATVTAGARGELKGCAAPPRDYSEARP